MIMIYEKSCGAVVYRMEEDGPRYLVEHMKKGHNALCKGHVEANESEAQTAEREIREETGLCVTADQRFRACVKYSPYENCVKTVVYFCAETAQKQTVPQPEEVESILWLPLEEACEALTYENDRQVLRSADRYIGGLPHDR